METPKTFKELFTNTGIEPTTDESGNTHYNFKATLKEKPKQETLEEAGKECLQQNSLPLEGDFAEGYITGSLFGAKWQQERMYSEEEVREMCSDAISSCTDGLSSHYQNFQEWFEQNKKK